MEWILVNQEGLLTSVQRAQIISRELYNISRPAFVQGEHEAEYKLFEYVTHPERRNDAALIVDTSHVIKVHPSCTLEKLIAVFPELSIDERFTLSSVIHQSQAFPFGLILPDTVTVRDKAYMIANGWIEADK